MSDKELVSATIKALAAIDAELGLPEDGCNSTARTLTAIRLLHSVHRDDVAEIERLHEQMERGTAALRVAFGEELWRLGHPAYVVVHLRDEIERLSAEVAQLTAERDGPRNRCPQCDQLRLELGEARHRLAALPADWRKDSSLETWFPITAMQMESLQAERDALLARVEAAAREAVAAWMIEHAFATGHGDTLTDLLAELSWQIAEIKRDAIKWRDTPIPVPPGECPYPVHADHSIKACVDAGDCGCGQNKT